MADINMARLAELQSEVLAHRLKVAEEKAKLQTLQNILDEAEAQLLALMNDAGLTSFKSALGTVSVAKRFQVKLPQTPDDWEKFWPYLKEAGAYEALRTVNYQRLNGWYKEELEAARERGDLDWHPPGLSEPSYQDILSFRK